MNLNIEGRWALVCAASKGLGKGCAQALVAEGVNVVITARGSDALEATAQALRTLNPAVTVKTVPGDITTSEGRAAALAAAPHIDILVNNAGGPPPGDFRNWSREDWIAAVDANMLTPIELIKATVDGMAGRGFGRIVNITSGAVKAPIDVLGHPGGMSLRRHGRFPEKYFRALMTSTLERRIAIEINSSYLVDMPAFLALCEEINPYVSIGSDAHRLSELGRCRDQLLELGVGRS